MGTYSGYRSRKAIFDELRPNMVRWAWVGNHLWSVDTHGIICLDLVMRFGPHNWAYKPIDETMHPYYYDCPLSILNGTPFHENPNIRKEQATWRAACYAFSERKKSSRLQRSSHASS